MPSVIGCRLPLKWMSSVFSRAKLAPFSVAEAKSSLQTAVRALQFLAADVEDTE